LILILLYSAFKKLTILNTEYPQQRRDQLQLNMVFDGPSQFQVSFELLSTKELRGTKGLMMRAITTPDQYWSSFDNQNWTENEDFVPSFDPCEETIDMVQEQLDIGNYEPCIYLIELLQRQIGVDEPWSFHSVDHRTDIKTIYRQFIRILKDDHFPQRNYSETYGIFTDAGVECLINFIRSLMDAMSMEILSWDNDNDTESDWDDSDTE
jgi:hypothetical protein